MHLAEIIVYPVKSLGGVSLKESTVLQSGLEFDRRWVLVNENYVFVSQRNLPKMATLAVNINTDSIYVHEKNNEQNGINIPIDPISNNPINVTVWDDEIESFAYKSEINDWFKNYLGQKLILVKMNPDKMRQRSLTVEPFQSKMSYADGYPFLVLSKASVQQISDEIGESIDIRQFRPNLILDDCLPFEEDEMKQFSIGEVKFNMVKPCKRCKMIGINQDSGASSNQPILYLSKTRKEGNHIIFGMNAALRSSGTIHVGDKISK